MDRQFGVKIRYLKNSMQSKDMGFVLTKSLLVLAMVVASQTLLAAQAKAGGATHGSIARGKQVYQDTCLACHQADGAGVPNMNPSLIKAPLVLGDKAKLIRVVLQGMTGELVVNGDTFDKPMPPFSSTLTDQQIADVLTYVRNSFGNKATPISATEVKAIRAKAK
jgi:mono/diheme cytochrome c family protein